MLSLQELVVFVTAADGGSFSEAGRLLHLSQPSVSQAIQNLEKRLGAQLFVRVGRSAQLSEIGEILLPMARELLANANQLEEAAASLHGSVVGKLDIGCSTTSGKYLLPKLIAGFREKFSNIRIDVLIHSRESVLQKLLEGQISFGVSSKQVEHYNLEYMPFFSDEVILIAPAAHAWSRYRHIHLDDLLDVPIILRESSSGTSEVVAQALEARGISLDMLKVVMVLGNAEAIEMSVEEGIGVAFVSRLAAKRGLELGRVIEVSVGDLQLRRNLYLVWNQRFPASRAQKEFLEFVRESMPLPDLSLAPV